MLDMVGLSGKYLMKPPRVLNGKQMLIDMEILSQASTKDQQEHPFLSQNLAVDKYILLTEIKDELD